MNAANKVEWRRFEGDGQVTQFMDAAVELHSAIFERLTSEERPFFYDYWLRILNNSAAFLATIDNAPHALVTQPFRSGVHQYRWLNTTLACSDELFGELCLPEDVDQNQPFMLSTCRVGSAIPNTRAIETQLGYVRSLREPIDELDDEKAWNLELLKEDDLEETLALMRRGYASDEEPSPDMAEQQTELRQIVDSNAGWCWIARDAADSKICGVVSYTAKHIPLAGVPGVLVSDLVVDPLSRRQGLSVLLQRYAYRQLRELGLRLVFGNIEPDNKASRRQAEILERKIWYRAIVFRAIEDSERA